MEGQEGELDDSDYAWVDDQEEGEGYFPSPSDNVTILDEFEDVKVLARSQSGDICAIPIKETGYLSFEQVRVELRACIEGLGEELVKEIPFSL